MHALVPLAVVLLLLATATLVAVAADAFAERIRVPAAAVFLIVAAAAAQLVPQVGSLSIVSNQRIVSVALVIILFDGGMHIGWDRIRTSVGAVVWLGVAGTLVTAAAMALGTHILFGFEWRTALLLGAALAPTDPAVVFSVLGKRQIVGRSGTLLEGESGANDPVGIALMVSLLGASGSGWTALGSGAGQFAIQLAIGTAAGLAGGWVIGRLPMPHSVLYPLPAVAVALLLYGGTTILHGSGFLAVFLAGILVGDAPRARRVERFAAVLATLAEVVAFVVLGLSVDLSSVAHGNRIWTALGIAALLVVVVRPLFVGLVLWPVRLARGDRVFVLLAGLKGAVPILLGTYVLAKGTKDAIEIYDIVFVVVLASVVVTGGLVPTFLRTLGIQTR